MKHVGAIRLFVVLAMIGALEFACRTGLINHRVIIPPSEMASALIALLASGTINADIARTLGLISIVIALSIIMGFAAGVLIHALPRLREALDPFFATYYAVPIFIF
jgi:NitT/TauT family transport system permease protein